MAEEGQDGVPIFFLRKLSPTRAIDVYGPGLIFELTTGNRFALPIPAEELPAWRQLIEMVAQAHAEKPTKQ
jgi:hypothetical protein